MNGMERKQPKPFVRVAVKERVLVVDDEPALQDLYTSIAEDMEFAVFCTPSIRSALVELKARHYSLLILDLGMPNGDGVEMLRELARSESDVPVLLISGQEGRILESAERLGKDLGLVMRPSLRKPVQIECLENALFQARTERGPHVRVARTSAAAEDAPAWLTAEKLAEGLRSQELDVHFQPKIRLAGVNRPSIAAFEALIRWNDRDWGWISPQAIVSVAESTSLIKELTDFVLRKVVDQLEIWRGRGFELPIAINVSRVQLTDLGLPDLLEATMKKAQLSPALLEVEITEQAAMADVSLAGDILTRLRLKGFSIALDDFGTGYSSLVELYRMPISELKFDRSLIVDVETDQSARTVVRALAALAKKLRLPICAEGVETQLQLQFLHSLGCELVQGFLFSRALPASEVEPFIRSFEAEEQREI
ncbi:MAG: EAL domain-containing response regulator [Congregibacter sp.]